jgi:CTP-dependent riboflavin kinase
MKEAQYDYIIIKGRIVEGLKEACLFTELPWAKEQFIEKLGIDPYPGTLNLKLLDDSDVEKYQLIAERNGIEIIPAGPEYCSAKCFPVLIGDKEEIKGALVIPLIPDYEKGKLEIISSVRLKDTLSLKINDVVSIKVFLSDQSS